MWEGGELTREGVISVRHLYSQRKPMQALAVYIPAANRFILTQNARYSHASAIPFPKTHKNTLQKPLTSSLFNLEEQDVAEVRIRLPAAPTGLSLHSFRKLLLLLPEGDSGDVVD